jgi:transcription factor C subunit 7
VTNSPSFRLQFRSSWVVDGSTGTYTATIPSPTNIPSDPALSSHGVLQSHELARKLASLEPPIERLYSSPFYRCLQTLAPTLELLQEQDSRLPGEGGQDRLKIRADPGLGEWYGLARFSHPAPAPLSLLSTLLPSLLDTWHSPTIVPSPQGESIAALHDRTAYALHRIIEACDAEGVKAIVVCTHAAMLLAAGRVLTGRMPADVGEEDFSAYTCGLSVFRRRKDEKGEVVRMWEGAGSGIPAVQWRGGRGVAGGWYCAVNGDCSFLSGGEERGW